MSDLLIFLFSTSAGLNVFLIGTTVVNNKIIKTYKEMCENYDKMLKNREVVINTLKGEEEEMVVVSSMNRTNTRRL